MNELLTAWDNASEALIELAIAADNLGHTSFGREAEAIGNALEARVTALSNMAAIKPAHGEQHHGTHD